MIKRTRIPQALLKLLKTSGFTVSLLTAVPLPPPLPQTDFLLAKSLEFNFVEIEAFEYIPLPLSGCLFHNFSNFTPFSLISFSLREKKRHFFFPKIILSHFFLLGLCNLSLFIYRHKISYSKAWLYSAFSK